MIMNLQTFKSHMQVSSFHDGTHYVLWDFGAGYRKVVFKLLGGYAEFWRIRQNIPEKAHGEGGLTLLQAYLLIFKRIQKSPRFKRIKL